MNNAIPTRAGFRFFCPLRVRYAEVDPQGVVFNAHYLTYYDTAITEYLRGLPYDLMGEATASGIDFHTVRSLVEYKAPIRFDQELEIGCRAARLGRSSLTFALGIFTRGGEALLATGEVVWVHTDQRSHRPVPVGDRLRALLEAREGGTLADQA
jgi:acyl-CoA thioester hydrolase